MSDHGPEDRVSFEELLGYFPVGRRTAHKWVRAGQIDSFKVAGRRYFSVEAVVAFELKRGRFSRNPEESARVAREAATRLQGYLQAHRGAGTRTGGWDDLVRRVERLERLLGARLESQEAAA
jgi:hypothetical protein